MRCVTLDPTALSAQQSAPDVGTHHQPHTGGLRGHKTTCSSLAHIAWRSRVIMNVSPEGPPTALLPSSHSEPHVHRLGALGEEGDHNFPMHTRRWAAQAYQAYSSSGGGIVDENPWYHPGSVIASSSAMGGPLTLPADRWVVKPPIVVHERAKPHMTATHGRAQHA